MTRDFTGQKFGRLTALKPTEKRINKKVVWLCKCDCGSEKEVISTQLTTGGTRSCGCLNKELSTERMLKNNKDEKFIKKREEKRLEVITNDYTGRRFGMIVAIKPTDRRKYKGEIVWEFKCDCGNICYKSVHQLSKNMPSCGCITYEKQRNNGLKQISNLNSECVFDTNVKIIRSKKIRIDNTSGCTGVYWTKHAKLWKSTIWFQKKRYDLGYYKKKADAIRVRKNAEEMLFEPFLEWYEEFKLNLKGE